MLHSREWPSNDFAMEFAHDLLMNHGTDPRITGLLDKGRVTVVPMQNPDGYDVSRRNVNGNQQKRGNCRFAPGAIPTQAQCDAAGSVNAGVNNNRNFLPFWGGNGSSASLTSTNYRGEAPLSEPENAAYADYLATHNVTIGIDMHTPDRRLLSVQSSLNEPRVIADQATYVNLTNSIADKNLVGWPHGPTLALTVGQPASFGTFVPGVGQSYDGSTAATVTSTAGDATLSVADPSSNAPGHLVNGTFSLAQPVQAAASKLGTPAGAFAPVPATLMGWTAPASNDAVTLLFRQTIGANEALRTGTYRKTLTFTLSTTNP